MSAPTEGPGAPTGGAVAAAAALLVVGAMSVRPGTWAFSADRFAGGAWWTPFTWPAAHLTVGHVAFTAVPAAFAAVAYSRRHTPAAAAAVAGVAWVACTAVVAVTANGPVAGSSGVLAAYAAAFAVTGPRRLLAVVAVIWLAAAGLLPGVSAAAHFAGIAAGAAVGLRHLQRQPAATPTGAPRP